MQALDVLDSPLQWETERQNRLHQAAIEQKKKQARNESPRPHDAVADDTVNIVSRMAHVTAEADWADKIFRIPAMRSALIPLDEASEGADWSKPFSLKKADVEPWLSFYKGYKESRLFPEASTASGNEFMQLDFAVRALLELKRVDPKIILEPPVQINAQVEYHDLEPDLRAGADAKRLAALVEVARGIHEKQLAQAVAKGREMGNLLHDALMGEGHANLVGAWEKQYKRKPTVQELHQMLTTGRVNPEKRQPSAAPQVVAQAVERKVVVPPRSSKRVVKEPSVSLAANVPAADPPEQPASPAAPTEALLPMSRTHARKILLYMLHAAVCASAVAAYLWVF
jgi:hypothetical protein